MKYAFIASICITQVSDRNKNGCGHVDGALMPKLIGKDETLIDFGIPGYSYVGKSWEEIRAKFHKDVDDTIDHAIQDYEEENVNG